MFLSDSRRYAFLGVVGLGLSLRIIFLTEESLWIDEAATIYYVRNFNLLALLFEVPITETHPPLYYTFMKIWTSIAGFSVFSLRFPSVIFGVGTIITSYAIGTEVYHHRIGLLTGLFVSVSRFHVFHSQNARMYSLLAFLSTLSFLYFIKLWEKDKTSIKISYQIFTVLTIYTHVFGLFVVLIQNIYIMFESSVIGNKQISLRQWLTAQSSIGILTSPWILLLGSRVFSVSGGSSPMRLSWIPASSIWTIPDTVIQYFIWGLSISKIGQYLIITVFIALAVVGAVPALEKIILRMTQLPRLNSSWNADLVDSHSSLLVIWLIIPIVSLFVVSELLLPLYVIRYTIIASIPFYILTAAGIDRLSPTSVSIPVVVIAICIVSLPLIGYYTTDQNGQWDEAAAYVEDNAEPGDLVVVTNYIPGYIQTKTAFSYYFLRPKVKVIGMADNAPDSKINESITYHDQVWIAFAYNNPANRQEIRRKLNMSYRITDTKRFRRISLYRYEIQ